MTRAAAIIGAGVIGAGWAARFLLSGWDVRVFDTDPEAERRVGAVLEDARRALPGLSDRPLPPEGGLSFPAVLSEAVAGAAWIQESLPERLALKRKVYQKIQAHCRDGAVIASSSARFTPAALQGCATTPAQILGAHPVDPVYLLPLVELSVSPANPPEMVARAEEVLQGLGMFPLHVTAESEDRIAERLEEALWREALGLVRDGIATPQQIDAAIRMGPGLRWAQMGPFETRGIAADLTSEPFDEVSEPLAAPPDAPPGRGLAQTRDAALVAMLRALKWADRGAGAHLNRVDGARPLPEIDIARPIVTSEHAVPLDWTDYNGHMTESRYLQAFADATDRFMEIIGVDAEYLASGGSFFTVETHIRHLMEVHAGAALRVETLCLGAEGKRMHLFHQIHSGDTLLATGEHMLLHVSLKTRRAAPPAPHVAGRLAEIAAAHAALPRPRGVGRAVGQGH
ncbi:3-hydroxyacyl-CoA dehydrogenase NAD-binding domain-containing protein [Actibacterium sp. MT2.3-13A]|uniref:3-hydroxyacyl-CoA dehydrogenase NAD-binding domain-containing protein n=1 Tax=Actibacterium sp. MT2.3-13A TaxID=2828332 RepID=UPI001BA7BF4C|nr:3-hydroxyacyl-CoA dehydrogenase NAD-binding domain-containing protein [Actibacterium sp. MT2.3-13A]